MKNNNTNIEMASSSQTDDFFDEEEKKNLHLLYSDEEEVNNMIEKANIERKKRFEMLNRNVNEVLEFIDIFYKILNEYYIISNNRTNNDALFELNVNDTDIRFTEYETWQYELESFFKLPHIKKLKEHNNTKFQQDLFAAVLVFLYEHNNNRDGSPNIEPDERQLRCVKYFFNHVALANNVFTSRDLFEITRSYIHNYYEIIEPILNDDDNYYVKYF